MRHHLFLIPGMFGFGRLATYDYFAHVVRAQKRLFTEAGIELVTHDVDVSPTASIRRRAKQLAELVAATTRDDGGPIHLLGHSTGGLDARLVASPSARLPIAEGTLAWLPRLRSVTTMNTPHYGTPLASFFATVSGQRILYGVSALTFIALSLGAPPLAAASALAVSIGQLDRAVLGMEIKIIERTTETLLKALEPASSREVRDYLDAIIQDQGAMIQLTPEAMDLFQAGVEDRAGVHYQSSCAMAPSPSARRLVRAMASPWRAVSSTLFTTLYGITSRVDERYPCAAAEPAAEEALRRALGQEPTRGANDGVVPVRSQVWGKVVWAGVADHLDVLGHFPSAPTKTVGSLLSRLADRVRGRTSIRVATTPPDPGTQHVDWLTSGAGFDDAAFAGLMRAISTGMIEASKARHGADAA